MCRRLGLCLVLSLLCLSWLPAPASAQSQIAGQVRDESGGVLPGVTVEAASPVLIEKTKTVVTDDQGRFTVVDLRPGTYKVSFTLTGFSTVVRDGLELPSNFTATVNADMKVGSLEETITVSGASPMVDIQQASRTQVLSRDLINTLPSTRNIMSVGMLMPGVRLGTPDVGGSQAMSQTSPRVHGVPARENVQMIDGMSVQTNEDGVFQAYQDEATAGEISLTTSAIPAETSAGGMRTNTIPKDGGNSVSGAVFLGGSDGGWQSKNVDEALKARRLTTANGISHVQTFSGSMGGPVKRDKLWYFLTVRHISADQRVANVPEVFLLAPNGELVRTLNDQYIRNTGLRMTWQATQKIKFGVFYQRFWKHLGKIYAYGQDPRTSLERDPRKALSGMGTGKWTIAASNKLLFEAGFSTNQMNYLQNNSRYVADRTSPLWLARAQTTDTALHVSYDCAYSFGCTDWNSNTYLFIFADRRVWSSSMTYVTGTHNFKVGFQDSVGPDDYEFRRNGDLIARYSNNAPTSVTVFNDPVNQKVNVKYDLGVYVQDSWTIKRLTVNPGVRFEKFNASAVAVNLPAGRFAPARSFAEQKNLPNWSNVAPRMSVAYDLFGNGRTAVKASASKYYSQQTGIWTKRYANSGETSESRNWFDCPINAAGTACTGVSLPTNLDGIAQDSEIGPSSSATFGQRSDRNPEPGIKRTSNWEYTTALQHSLTSRISVSLSWYHRVWSDLEVSDRTLISTSDYSSFQLPMPSFSTDPTLTGLLDPASMVTVYNLNAAKRSVFGAALIDKSSKDQSIYNGVETSFNARLPHGARLFGGWTAERNQAVYCSSDDNPNGPPVNDLYLAEPAAVGGAFCDQRKFNIPLRNEFKLAGNYPIAFGVDVAAALQSYGGLHRTITWQPAANLFPGGRTNAETLILNAPGSLSYPRYNQLDLNVKKIFRSGRKTFTAQVDLFNALNGNAIFSINNAIGASLGQVQSILTGRLPRLAFQMNF